MSGFLKTYNGKSEPGALAAMKEALASHGLCPRHPVDKVLFCAGGWARRTFYADWKKWSAASETVAEVLPVLY